MAKRSTSALYEDFNKFVESQKKNTKTVDSKLIDDFKKFRQSTSSTREAQQYVQQQQKAEDRLQKSREKSIQDSLSNIKKYNNNNFLDQVQRASDAYDKLFGKKQYTSAGDYATFRNQYGNVLDNVDKYINEVNYLTRVGEIDRTQRNDYLKSLPNVKGTRLLNDAGENTVKYSQYKDRNAYNNKLEEDRIRNLDQPATQNKYNDTKQLIENLKKRASDMDVLSEQYDNTWRQIRQLEEENDKRYKDLNAWSQFKKQDELQQRQSEEYERIKNLDLAELEKKREALYKRSNIYQQIRDSSTYDNQSQYDAITNSIRQNQTEIDALERDITAKRNYDKANQYSAITDTLGESENFNETYARQNNLYAAINASVYEGNGTGIRNIQEAINTVTDDERRTYNRIVAESGFDAGAEYIDFLRPTLNARLQQNVQEGLADYSEKHAIGGVLANVMASYAKPTGALYTLVHNIENGFKGISNYRAAVSGSGNYQDITELDINSPWFAGSMVTEATTEGLTRNQDAISKFLTQTGLSILQNVSQMGLGEPATLAIMGLGSMADTARDIKRNGGSDSQALIGGTLAGITEVLFEKVSLDSVIKMAQTGNFDDLMKNLAKQGFIEGSEEVFTEATNIVTDYLVNGGSSDLMDIYNNYRRLGYSEREAEQLTFKDLATQVGMAGLGGALSGAVMGPGATAAGYANSELNTYRLGKDIIQGNGDISIDQLMQRASEISPDIGNAFSEKDLKRGYRVGNLYRDILRTEAQDGSFTKNQFIQKYSERSNRNVKEGRTGKISDRFDMTKSFADKVNDKDTSVYFDHISDDDTVYVRTDDNRVIKADSLSEFKNKQLFENAADFGKEGAKAFVNNYDGNLSVTDYKTAFQIVVGQAYEGTLEQDAIQAGIDAGLTETQARSAFYVGQNKANAYKAGYISNFRNYANTIETEQIKEQLKEVIKGNNAKLGKVDTTNIVKKYQKVFDNEHVKVSSDIDFSTVDETRQESLAAAVTFIRALGRDVNILTLEEMSKKDSDTNKVLFTANAYFRGDENAYYLCIEQMNDAFMNIAMHETVHDIRQNAPKEYAKLKETVLKHLEGSDTFNLDLMHEFELLDKNKVGWENASEQLKETAYEELVANTVTAILNDPSTLQDFADKFITDEETREIFVGFLDKLLHTFRAAFDKVKKRLGWRQIQKIENNLQALEDIRNAYFEGLEGLANTERLSMYNIENQTQAERENLSELSKLGIELEDGDAVYRFSARTWGHSEAELADMAQRLVDAGFDEEYSKGWVADIDSVYTLVMEEQKSLDYRADERYSFLKKNSDYTQGSIDFNNNCPKRVEFTALFDRLLQEFPNTVFTDEDFETIRGILKDNGIAVTCGICFVEDRRQKLGTVAQTYIDMLKDGSLAPMFKNLIKGDTYIPTQYDLITYEGFYNLWKNHPGVYESFRRYNNHRGMASIRLVEGMGEYRNEIKKWTKRTITSKNNKGGLRIFSTSDADPRIMLDTMQIVADAASKGLQIQGYTKKPWFAKLVKDTGIRLLRSHIPAGIGYETVNGREVLTYDNVEGINRRDPDYFDSTDSLYIGNNVIGINDHQIRIAMTDPMIDQIIPFHSNQRKEVLNKKKIGHYENYKLEQTDKVGYYSNGEGAVGKQINIYTQVIKEFENRGMPIKNKYDFVNAYLQVCKEKDLCPRFWRFLDKDANGDYVYTEGYHKFLVDYKMFDKNGNYIPQVSVTPAFDMEVANATIKKYVKMDEYINKAVAPEVKEKAYQEMKEVVQNKLKFSVNTDSLGNELTEEQQEYFKDSKIRDNNGNLKVMYHGTNADFNIFDQLNFGEVGDTAEGFGIYLTDTREVADSYGGRIIEAYANVTRPASKNAKTIKRAELARLIKATCENEAKSLMEDGYDSIEDALKDTWVSNYTYTYDKPMNAVYNQVAADILRMNDNDMDIVQEVMSGMAIRDYAKAYEFYPLLTETMGIDGFETTWEDSRDPENPAHIVVAFNSEQVKSIDNKTPTSNPDIRYSRVTDAETLDMLENQEHVTVYRAMAMIDGKLYPPMATKVRNAETGKYELQEPTEIGQWYQSDERSDLIDQKTGKWKLKKDEGTDVNAAYNPYWHTSMSVLNDQFTSAYKRPNLVVVQGEVPSSELTSGYKAQYAKDAVGKTEWHSGTVSSDLKKAGKNAREVILSRWFKPVRVLTDAEVAQGINDMVSGTNIAIPFNVVTPGVRAELEKLGVPIGNSRGLREVLDKDSFKEQEDTETVANTFIPVEERQFTYEEFVNKKSMPITDVSDETEGMNRTEIVNQSIKNAKALGRSTSKGAAVVHVKDTNKEVIISPNGIRHGLTIKTKDLFRNNAVVSSKYGEILENSILLNVLNDSGRDSFNVINSDVYIGIAREGKTLYIVRSIVNNKTNDLEEYSVLYAIDTKKESAAQSVPAEGEDLLSSNTDPTIKISDILELVNKYFPDILPEDVYKHFGHETRPDGELGKNAKYAINPDSIDLSSLNNSDDKNLDNFKNAVGTQYKLNIAKKLTPEVADKMAGRILREYHSSYAREELSQQLTALINDAARQGKDLDVDTFINQGAALLSDVLEKSTEFNQEAYDADDKVRSYLNGIKIKLTSTQEQEVTSAFESVRAYRAGLFGSAVKINQSTGISLDVIWGELSALNPVLFPADAGEGDMPMYLADAAQMLKKANYYFNPYGFDAEGMGAIIFADMVADYADDTRIKTVVNQMKAYGRHYFSDTMKDLNRRTRERAAQQKAHTEKLKADLARVKEETRKYLNDMDELILDINNKITQAEYEMKALPAGSDRFDYEQTIAGLKKTRERYEYSVREWKRQQTEEAQRLQKEIEESAKNYLKAGGKGINYAMDARQAVIRTRSLVQQKQLKEQAQRRTVINTVRRNANNLLGRLLNSSDTRHVPENLRIPVASFLQNLDLGFTGEESNAAVTWIENIGKLADKMRNFNEANGTFQVDDMIIEQLNDIASDLRIRLETAGKRLSDMSLYELQQLRDTVSLINAAIYNSDRLLADGRKQRASSLAERSINEMAGKKQRKHTKGILKMAGDFFSIDQLDSFSYAERLGSDFNNVIFKNLRKGFDTKVKYVQQGNEAFAEALKKLAPDEKTAKRLLKTMSGDNAVSTAFMLESGNTLTLTPAQVMELYLLNNREDARRHIYNGGITVMEYGKGKNTVKKQEMVQVTESDVKNIIDTLTPQQKAFADAMQKFAATSISEWGNNVSMTLWGIKKFTDPNYWKIRSDSNTLNAIATEKNSPDNVGLYHLKNLGSSKATNPLATNPLIVGDAIDSFVSHVDEMSSYGAYTVPLDDAMKWYNYKNGNRTTQRAIENYMGIAGKEYFTDFIKTLNSSQPNAGGMPILDKLISNAKVAAIAANLRVVIQQPSAYARAMDVIDPKYLVQTGNPKAGAEEAQKYCSIAAWKNWGFRDADIGRSLRDVMVGDEKGLIDTATDVAGKPAGWFDDVTWGAIWNAVKAEVKDKNPQLRIGTQEFYDAVSERFTEVIDKTQVVDSPFHRSKGMRSKNMLWKMATAFMSEPTKSYNMFYRTVSDAYQNGVNARTAKRFTRALVSFVTATALNSMLASIIDAIRHRDDDEDKDFWERYFNEVGQNIIDGLNPLNLIPIGKDIMSMIQGYDPSRLDLDALNRLIQTGKQAFSAITGDRKDLKWERIFYDLVGEASKVTGIPAGNFLRTVDSVTNLIGKAFGKDIELFGKYKEWSTSKKTAGNMYTEYKKTGKWTEDLLNKYVSMTTDEVIKEEEQRELEGHNRKYATTEDVTRYATNQVYGNFASMLAEDDERIAEAYEAKVSGNSATVTRIKKAFTDAGIPGEIFDKAVLVYGNSLEESDPKSIRDFNAKLYDYDDLAEAIVNGYDTEDIYNEIISDSTAQDPEKNTVSHTMERLEEYYKKYMLDGNTRKAEQIIDNAQKTFELDDSRFESWSKSVDYIQFSEQHPNVNMTQDDYQRYQKVASSGITPETWMQYYEQANTLKAEVDSNGEAIRGSKKKKVLVLIDSLPITDAQKDALYYYNNWAESKIKEAPWH